MQYELLGGIISPVINSAYFSSFKCCEIVALDAGIISLISPKKQVLSFAKKFRIVTLVGCDNAFAMLDILFMFSLFKFIIY